ncbi:protein of unknown function [Hyphomicrobium sp. MC1]|nr:protein of unknown function [Hyphomicrobium sp. MC1]
MNCNAARVISSSSMTNTRRWSTAFDVSTPICISFLAAQDVPDQAAINAARNCDEQFSFHSRQVLAGAENPVVPDRVGFSHRIFCLVSYKSAATQINVAFAHGSENPE